MRPPETPPNIEADDEPEEEPSTSSWFNIDEESKGFEAAKEDAGSETEPDSDNEDVNEPEVTFDEDDETSSQIGEENASQEVRKVRCRAQDKPTAFPHLLHDDQSATPVRMGEDEDAMHYDQDLIFKHL